MVLRLLFAAGIMLLGLYPQHSIGTGAREFSRPRSSRNSKLRKGVAYASTT
jgi:hypothetical protein